MDFLKAEIIVGLTGINTKYHKHKQVTDIAAKESNKTGWIILLRPQTCKCLSIDLHYSF